MYYDRNRALELLRVGTDMADAEFRSGQEEAIRHLIEGRGKLLVVQRTGWGKSFVYFISAKLIKEAGGGPTLLISPLLSLMRNQIAAAVRMGVHAVTINSSNVDEWEDAKTQLLSGSVDVLLVSPERLANENFLRQVLDPVSSEVAMLVIDEVHCVSDWGHDLRPDYRRIERILQTLPDNFRLIGTTATANDRVVNDLVEVFGPNLEISRGDLSRSSLFLQTLVMPSQAERMGWLAERLVEIPGSGIVYVLTIRDAERVASWLRTCGLSVECYTSRSENRESLEQALLENEVKALVATTALSMGFDKPDLSFVIHYQTPGSVIAYYQQVGRAGRALNWAYGALLSGDEDTEITDYFIDNAFPSRIEVSEVIAALSSQPDGASLSQLQTLVNISQGRMKKALKLLSLESPSPVVKDGSHWRLTPVPLSQEFWQRAERLTTLRHKEQREMQAYVRLASGHMEFLIDALDGQPEVVSLPNVRPLTPAVSQHSVRRAIEFLQRASVSFEPRLRWPQGGLPSNSVKGNIAVDARAETGRALCVWGDAGYGKLVSTGKYRDDYFSEELVSASVRSIAEWNPQPSLVWVTCIPSRRRPILVSNFAERLARKLGLQNRPVLIRIEDRPEQKRMANSAQQVRNIDGSLDVLKEDVLDEPVLLVDDIVDSRWTMTVGAWLLRNADCGLVFPFALATSAGG